jgi:hypothetical protein
MAGCVRNVPGDDRREGGDLIHMHPGRPAGLLMPSVWIGLTSIFLVGSHVL